jgi:hypothetical protein
MRLPIAFPTLRSASAYIAAERALSTREHRRGNVVIDGGFDILRDTQVPIIDAVRADRTRMLGEVA